MCDGRSYFEYFDADLAAPWRMGLCTMCPPCDRCVERDRLDLSDYDAKFIRKCMTQLGYKVAHKVLTPEVFDMHGAKSVYELTLTTTKDDPVELVNYLNKIVKSAMFDVSYWESCIELTQAGVPHIHAILYCKRDHIDASKIKAPKGINFPYIYTCKKVRSLKGFINYIRKEENNPLIIEYCRVKGVSQFLNA